MSYRPRSLDVIAIVIGFLIGAAFAPRSDLIEYVRCNFVECGDAQ